MSFFLETKQQSQATTYRKSEIGDGLEIYSVAYKAELSVFKLFFGFKSSVLLSYLKYIGQFQVGHYLEQLLWPPKNNLNIVIK